MTNRCFLADRSLRRSQPLGGYHAKLLLRDDVGSIAGLRGLLDEHSGGSRLEIDNFGIELESSAFRNRQPGNVHRIHRSTLQIACTRLGN